MLHKHKQNNGFTLIEVLIYTGILAMVGTIMSGVLFNATKIKGRETASIEVNNQLSFALESIQRSVMDSSVIDIAPGTSTSTLVLKFKDESQNPTKFYIADGVLYEQVAANDPQPITSKSVVANAVNFLKVSGYTGHDSVQVDLTLSYNTANSSQDFAFTRSLSSAIARVNAATFDSNLIPGSDQFYDIGQTSARWNNMYLSGNLGIGTTNPVGPLDVNGKLTVLSAGNVGIGTTTPWGLLSVNSNAIGTAPTFVVGSSTATNFIVTNSGNVGIGTTAPGAKLEVNGDAYIQGSGNRVLRIYGTGVSDTAQLNLMNGDYSWAIKYDGTDNRKLKFQYNASSPVDRLTIDNQGNVGIGTTNPLSILHMYGASPTLIQESSSYADGSYTEIIMQKNAISNGGVRLRAVRNSPTDSTYDFTISQELGGAIGEKMRIKGNGNVGIGTTAPGARLDLGTGINGDLLRFQSDTTNGGRAYINALGRSGIGNLAWGYGFDSNGLNFGMFRQTDGNGVFRGSLYLHANGGGIVMDQDALAVGGSALANKLDVYGSIAAGSYAGTAAPSNGMIISGNVGIGTASPGTNMKLQVVGDIVGAAQVFRARMTADFAKTASTWQKIPFNSVIFNTLQGTFDTTNNRFTALRAGYYQISVTGYSSTASAADDRFAIGVYKNGVIEGFTGTNYSAVDTPMTGYTGIVYLNGSTDYVEIWGFSAIAATWKGQGTVGHEMFWYMNYLGT